VGHDAVWICRGTYLHGDIPKTVVVRPFFKECVDGAIRSGASEASYCPLSRCGASGWRILLSLVSSSVEMGDEEDVLWHNKL